MLEGTPSDYERCPFGRYTITQSCVLWCASPTLAGWHVWGRPGVEETTILLRSMSCYVQMETPFDVVADTRGVELVNTAALPVLVSWVMHNRAELRKRIRLQANVIQRDSIGFLLVGIIASVGDTHALRSFTDPLEAFRTVSPKDGPAVCEEVESLVARARGVPHELHTVRSLLASNTDAPVRDAARILSTSTRSLQRILGRHGTSYHDEQTNARFTKAQALLRGSDIKVAHVASRVGWSTRTLTNVFRTKTGLSPADWRKTTHQR